MEYKLKFAEKLISAAESLADSGEIDREGGRAVLYLSLLSCEISLKSMLEKAGFTIKELTKRSHDISGLLDDLCSCELSGTGFTESKEFSGSRLLSKVVVKDTSNGTVGSLLRAEGKGASVYPNSVRYGDVVSHFPPMVMLECAKIVSKWANDHFEIIKRRI